MPSVRVQPFSLLAGASLSLVMLMAMGQNKATNMTAISIGGAEDLLLARSSVRIEEGTPYQVPPGRRFFLRALGRTEGPGSNQTCLRIDGVDVLLDRSGGDATPTSVKEYPVGLFADEGSIIEIWTDNVPWGGTASGLGVAYGFEKPMISPQLYVQIDEGTAFVVPNGKLLVPTAATSRDEYDPLLILYLDGAKEMWIGDRDMAGLPKGLAISEGVSVTIGLGVAGANDARLWGYLVDA